MRRFGPLLAAIILVAAGAFADEPYQPTQQQLTELLSGNSMEGIWAGRPYLQYFDPDGITHYRERGGEETEGRWRVDENGRYCSVWPPAERWVCYQVTVIGNSLYWKSGGQYYPAEIRVGKVF